MLFCLLPVLQPDVECWRPAALQARLPGPCSLNNRIVLVRQAKACMPCIVQCVSHCTVKAGVCKSCAMGHTTNTVDNANVELISENLPCSIYGACCCRH